MNLVTYPDREMMMIDLANRLAGEINTALMAKGQAAIAVPGGTTPGPVFDTLSGVDLDWANVTVMLTDERCVPETSPRSNTRLLRERLLVGKAAKANLLSFAIDPATELEALRERLRPHLPLDLVLLGMGADMHTASLFPGAPELTAALRDDAPPLVTMTPQDGLEPRVTLSAPVLKGAMAIHVVITGAEKREAIETAATLHDAAVAPIRVVLQDATIHWAE